MSAFASVLLPQPDSPASPRISPGGSRGHAVDRADRVRAGDVVDRQALDLDERVRRSRVALRRCREGSRHAAFVRGQHEARAGDGAGRAPPRAAAGSTARRSRRGSQPEHGDHEREPGEDERPPLALQHRRVRLRPVEHHAPADVGRVAEARGTRGRRRRAARRRRPARSAAAMRLIMFGMISPKTMRGVDSPATFAACTKSRSSSEAPARAGCAPRTPRASSAEHEDHRRHPAAVR